MPTRVWQSFRLRACNAYREFVFTSKYSGSARRPGYFKGSITTSAKAHPIAHAARCGGWLIWSWRRGGSLSECGMAVGSVGVCTDTRHQESWPGTSSSHTESSHTLDRP